MKKIELSGAKGKGKYITIDDEDYELVASKRWNLLASKGGAHYARHNSRKGSVLLHRFIIDCPKGMIIDHINFDTLDNRKSNLRVCTISQSLCHRRKDKFPRTSKYKGVCRSGFNGYTYWHMSINFNGKNIVKRFKREIDAAKEYNKLAKIHHKEFAVLNDI